MERKSRYCPSCGNKTNDLHCDICGRSTKSVSLRKHERELDIIEDDIQQEQNRNFDGDRGQSESKRSKRNTKRPLLKMEQGEHPYYEQTTKPIEQKYTIGTYAKAFVTLFIILFIVVLGVVIVGISSKEDDLTSFDRNSYDSYYDYLEVGNHEADAEIECSIVSNKKGSSIVVNNKSPYFIDGDIYHDHMYVDYQRMLAPYTTKTYAVEEKIKGTCVLECTGLYRYTFHEPTISYTVKEEKGIVKIYIQDSQEKDIQELMMYLISSYSLTNSLNQEFQLYQNGKLAYKMEIEEKEEQMHISFHEQKGFSALHEFTFDASD